jgi:uncharacterized RDD family membrane protein YckC
MALIDSTQTTLLRIAAFLVDALALAIILILPSSIISYTMAWIGGSVKAIQLVWWVTLGIFVIGIVIRDGVRGRSPGKHLLGLRLVTPKGDGCGWGRSIVRNLPLIVPGWNLVEAGMVISGRARSGDRIAHTTVTEE